MKTITVCLLAAFCLVSCSGSWHYFGKTGVVSEAFLDTPLIHGQGVTADSVVPTSQRSFDGVVYTLPIFDSINAAIVYNHESDNNPEDYITIGSKKNVLNVLWANFVDDIKEEGRQVNWYISSVSRLRTAKRKYLYIDFGNDINLLREYHYPLIIDYTNSDDPVVYTIPPTLNFGINAFGDFNADTCLDYTYIDEDVSRLRFDSLKDGVLQKNEAVYLQLRSIPEPGFIFSLYKVRHFQKHAGWW